MSGRGGPGGKRVRLTPELQDQVIVGLKSGGGVAYTAHAVGVTPRAIYALINRNPRFKERYLDAKEFRKDALAKALYNRGLKGSDTAAIFLLKNWAPSEYRDRHEYAVEGIESLIEASMGLHPPPPPDLPAAPAAISGGVPDDIPEPS